MAVAAEGGLSRGRGGSSHGVVLWHRAQQVRDHRLRRCFEGRRCRPINWSRFASHSRRVSVGMAPVAAPVVFAVRAPALATDPTVLEGGHVDSLFPGIAWRPTLERPESVGLSVRHIDERKVPLVEAHASIPTPAREVAPSLPAGGRAGCPALRLAPRRGGRVDECGGLENWPILTFLTHTATSPR
jgi:hypothetical protein